MSLVLYLFNEISFSVNLTKIVKIIHETPITSDNMPFGILMKSKIKTMYILMAFGLKTQVVQTQLVEMFEKL